MYTVIKINWLFCFWLRGLFYLSLMTSHLIEGPVDPEPRTAFTLENYPGSGNPLVIKGTFPIMWKISFFFQSVWSLMWRNITVFSGASVTYLNDVVLYSLKCFSYMQLPGKVFLPPRNRPTNKILLWKWLLYLFRFLLKCILTFSLLDVFGKPPVFRASLFSRSMFFHEKEH